MTSDDDVFNSINEGPPSHDMADFADVDLELQKEVDACKQLQA